MRTLEQALDLEFSEYMLWCHDWCRAKAAKDPIFADVYSTAAFSVLEALWAKRYWYHKNGVTL
jgi:hypothetical protein